MIPWGKSSSRRDDSFPLVLAKAISEWHSCAPHPPTLPKVKDPGAKVKKCSVWPGDFGRLMKPAGTLKTDPAELAQ